MTWTTSPVIYSSSASTTQWDLAAFTKLQPQVTKPSKSTPTTTAIGGVSVTAEQIESAIKLLTISKGPYVQPPLAAKNHPLANCDYKTVAQGEQVFDPSLRKGPQKTKTAFLKHLDKKLASLQPAKINVKLVTDVDEDQDLLGILDEVPLFVSQSTPPKPVEPSWQSMLDKPVDCWAHQTLVDYAQAHDVAGNILTCCFNGTCGTNILRDAVANHINDAKQKAAALKAAEDAILKFSYAPDQPTLSGYHPKHVLVDQHGGRWLFKPAPGGKRFRAEAAHGAHLLARLWGYKTAESRLIEFDGKYGQLQRMFTETGNLAGIAGAAFNALPLQQLIGVACEHILDWALDNDDAKGDNFVLSEEVGLVGVDKDRAWVYFGGWDGLSSHDSANSNAPLVYTELYRAIKAGHVDRDTVDTVYRAVITKARRMQALPDAQLARIVGDAVANRPHYGPPRYRPPVDGAPTNAAELIAAITARKNRLADDMDALWQRVYTGAGWQRPEPYTGPLGVNPQGHPIHTGLHSPELHAALTASKSYGTPTFVAGTEIEDAHILLWHEKVNTPTGQVTRVRGQWKTRGKAFKALTAWCKANTVDNTRIVSDEPPRLWHNEHRMYDYIIQGAKTVSFHSEDGHYNTERLTNMLYAKSRLEILRQHAQECLDEGKPDRWGRYAARIEMATQYLGYIATIENHKANKTKSQEGDFPRYVYEPVTPPPPPEPDPDAATVVKVAASRAAASFDCKPVLDDNGELVLDAIALDQPGTMYLVTLPTGEEIEFRSDTATTGTPVTLHGQTQFTIPDQTTIAESLERIATQLAAMGLDIQPADRDDLELYYWRHLAGVMAERADSKRKGATTPQGGAQPAKYAEFWARHKPHRMTKANEITMWRHAYAAITSPEQIEAFVAAGGHLPRFMHMDLRQPDLPCGKPYWERFDVTEQQWQQCQMPVLHYRNGPRWVIATGVAMSTEARTRTFAIWKAGQSSRADMEHGSADFIFTRINQERLVANPRLPSVLFNPRVLTRTTTYGFGGDLYGRINERPTCAFFDFPSATGWQGDANETLIKDSMSLLDDIEILVFDLAVQRQQSIDKLAALGLTEIRGVPVSTRFVHRGDNVAAANALAAVKESYKNAQPG